MKFSDPAHSIQISYHEVHTTDPAFKCYQPRTCDFPILMFDKLKEKGTTPVTIPDGWPKCSKTILNTNTRAHTHTNAVAHYSKFYFSITILSRTECHGWQKCPPILSLHSISFLVVGYQ